MAEEKEIEDTGADSDLESGNTMTAAEEKASKSGWRPKDDWKGEPEDWIDAPEFNYRGELMGRISEQSSILNNFKNQIAERDKTIEDLVTHHKGVSEREYKKALKTLQDAKIEALDEGDGSAVVEIDNEIDELRGKKKAADTHKPANKNIQDSTPPEVIDWLQKPQNKWYVNDSFLKSVADGIAKDLMQKNPNISPTNLLTQMDVKMREELPHKFEGNPSVNETEADDLTQSSNSGKKPGRKLGMRDLNEEQQAIVRRFIKTKVMTLGEYIDDLKAIGEL